MPDKHPTADNNNRQQQQQTTTATTITNNRQVSDLTNANMCNHARTIASNNNGRQHQQQQQWQQQTTADNKQVVDLMNANTCSHACAIAGNACPNDATYKLGRGGDISIALPLQSCGVNNTPYTGAFECAPSNIPSRNTGNIPTSRNIPSNVVNNPTRNTRNTYASTKIPFGNCSEIPSNSSGITRNIPTHINFMCYVECPKFPGHWTQNRYATDKNTAVPITQHPSQEKQQKYGIE
jgi:hypothetical protein